MGKTMKLNSEGLKVSVNKEIFLFHNTTYSMELFLYKKDFRKFLKNPCNNFRYRMSYGNNISPYDKKYIILFLKEGCEYKTVSNCVRYSKIDKLEENLDIFTTEELYKYVKKNIMQEKKKGEKHVKSST